MRPFSADSLWTYDNKVLKNKFNIKDKELLNKKEKEITHNKINNLKDYNDFSLKGFLNLHKYLFEDLYNFAGQIRDENVTLDNIMLCQFGVIELCLKDLFRNLKEVKINSHDDMLIFLAYYYSELMVILPFRDGNEVTIKLFLELYLKKHGYNFDFKKIDNAKLWEATKYAFYYNPDKLYKLLKETI